MMCRTHPTFMHTTLLIVFSTMAESSVASSALRAYSLAEEMRHCDRWLAARYGAEEARLVRPRLTEAVRAELASPHDATVLLVEQQLLHSGIRLVFGEAVLAEVLSDLQAVSLRYNVMAFTGWIADIYGEEAAARLRPAHGTDVGARPASSQNAAAWIEEARALLDAVRLRYGAAAEQHMIAWCGLDRGLERD
jgi:hypothetical protein